MSSSRVLITGVSGFIGRRLANVLSARGHSVAGTFVDDNEPELGLELYRADLLDPAALADACERFGPDRILHLAGLSRVGASFDQPEAYHRVNVVGTENLLNAAGAAPVVLASSAEVYGKVPADELPIDELRPPAPQSPYGETKVAAERLVLAAGGVAVRCFNVVGPGQSDAFALPGFARQLAEIAAGLRDPIVKVGNLDPWRDFIHLDDAVHGYAVVLERGEAGAIYNLATGRAHSIGRLLDRLIELSGVEVTVEKDPERLRPSDAPKIAGDSSRLRALGWTPRHQIDDALRSLLDNARARLRVTQNG